MEDDLKALDDIFVDKNEPIDIKLIREILLGKVTIDPEGRVVFTEEGEKLTDNKKVLIYLVCRKAMIMKGFLSPDEEAIGPTKISQKLRVGVSNTKKTTKETFSKLLENKKGKYYIPNHNLKKVKAVLSKDG